MENPNILLRRIEQAGMWAYFHKDWLLAIRTLLRPQLPSEYHLFVESEAILISPVEGVPSSTILPDVAVGRKMSHQSSPSNLSTKGTAAVIEVEEPCEIDTHYSLIIRRAPENYVVAVLEILSPSNKGGGSRLDEEKHLRKRDSMLDSGVQLMEIDALIEGRRNLPPALSEKLSSYSRVAWTAAHYDGRRKYRGWGWNESEPLPTIPWFIDDGRELYVDLADAAKQAFDFNRWDDLVPSAENPS